MGDSILDFLGSEIVGIISPVSICMVLVVLLVKVLEIEVSDTVLTSVASLIYSEDSTDSDWTKFLGALINAGVFVLVVTVVTFLLVLLFYYRCTKCLRIYTALGAFTVLAYMGGSIAVMLIQELELPIDVITASIILYNFAVVGVLSVFFCRVPILVTQGYLVLVGTLVAFWFTSLPEWTTWVLLVAISLYDIIAVLTPGGPLNMLVQLAMTRDEEIPALIYEARPRIASGGRSTHLLRPRAHATRENQESLPMLNGDNAEELQRRIWKRRSTVTNEGNDSGWTFESLYAPLIERKEESRESAASSQIMSIMNSSVQEQEDVDGNTDTVEQSERTLLHQKASIQGLTAANLMDGRVLTDQKGNPGARDNSEVMQQHETLHQQTASMRALSAVNGTDMRMSSNQQENSDEESSIDDDEGIGLGASGAIKLGLGDFIFYSVLVGRAALFDMTTVYSSYMAIITGLGATLGLLAVWRRALPALPISIGLGLVFYFLTRFLMEPFILQFGGNLVFI
ncbi:hypothetical protein KP509_09G055800 [Ceratopteris richardii]|uniref:Presenilin n=1 Tax=Ceratopteris richardii TaxID=49495 RepID=A0A8T2U4D3_CERRI|nr:hypothetical protein KP509_09G055800 [Ceratopteris richardii]KAH7429555.1 hypothetical protein KP509_09G055800 [Ceratopteris richardii]KAH7429556.1 hypothetical protein KP509_09G055800 [Ceratopteris richardii]KAH7429558.1 hypothetical protein KP509_09G055800 [Ceratopteris richardii]KAH7429559.1 hypothetical protein KP509_09G055800 [Ceratopteris richardii]